MNARYRRVVLGSVLSVFTFGWCVLSARSDNRRWVRDLHQGHRSPAFRQALAQVQARSGGSARPDECSVCHGSRSWLPALLDQRPPVSQESCRQCHEATPASGAGSGHSALGVSWLGDRVNRRAHWGEDYQGSAKVVGIPASPDRKIRCSECHVDHQGSQLVDVSFVPGPFHDRTEPAVAVPVERPEEGKPPVTRYRFTRVCAECHLPSRPSPEATRVLKAFLDGHKGDFEPAIPDPAAKPVIDAPDNTPLPAGAQQAFIRAVLDAMKQQTNRRAWRNESLRGCTPGCHGEHTKASGDAEDEKYRLTAPSK